MTCMVMLHRVGTHINNMRAISRVIDGVPSIIVSEPQLWMLVGAMEHHAGRKLDNAFVTPRIVCLTTKREGTRI